MSRYASQKGRALKAIAGHRTSDRSSRCFDFRSPGTSNYAFSLTWTPGSLMLAGDMGEMTLTHYHALWKLEDGLAWAARADHDYLLGKSDKTQVYEAEGTVRQILEIANEPAGRDLAGWRQELRRWRQDRPQADQFTPTEDDPDGGFAMEMEAWLEDKPRGPRRDFYQTGPSYDRKWEIPAAWWLWERLRERFADHLDPPDILQAQHRATIRDELASYLGDVGAERAAELCCRLEICDFYGDQAWSFQAIQQITAMRWGAQQALRWLEGERVYSWHDALPPLEDEELEAAA